MSRLRHHKKEHEHKHAEGGSATETGGNPHVFSLAKEHHSIGTIGGEKSKKRLDRKRGGSCRKEGGGLKGSDTHPYSSFHRHGGEVHHKEGHMHHGAEHHKKEHEHRGRHKA